MAGRGGWIALALLALAGCNGGQPKLAQVQGRVFYRGQAVPGGTIVFTPDPDRGCVGPLASADIGADGRYVLHTGQEPGAVPGWHRITVAPPASPPAGAPMLTASWSLPRRFSHPQQSGQCLEVKAGVVNTLDVQLE